MTAGLARTLMASRVAAPKVREPCNNPRVTDLATRIAAALASLGTEERAVAEKAYLKSSLVHLGVGVPKLRATVKALARAEGDALDHGALVAAVEAMWGRGIFELRAAGVELLALRGDLLGPGDVPLLERLLREARTWALVDYLATTVVGRLVTEHPALVATLDGWAADDDFWIRRSALLALLGPLRKGGGDFERFGIYADAMLEEKEFFIRKAIGWVLREVSKKRPQLVVEWLAPRAHRAAGLTVREATRHLTVKQQMTVLANVMRGRATR
jgi:3-methyladenine DNA glycosylase AlkD